MKVHEIHQLCYILFHLHSFRKRLPGDKIKNIVILFFNMKIERIPTYIPGIDSLIEGGFPKGNTILLSGYAGSGKTIFSLQYLYEGAKRGEKGMFISLEMLPYNLIQQASRFGWDIKKYIDNGTLLFKHYDLNTLHISTVIKNIKLIVDKFNPVRLVLDSLTVLSVYAEIIETSELAQIVRVDDSSMFPSKAVTRRSMTNLITLLDIHPVTSLLTSELAEHSNWLSRDTVSEFICDGIIILKTRTIGQTLLRTVEIRKMRLTDLRGGEYGFAFTKKGIVVDV